MQHQIIELAEIGQSWFGFGNKYKSGVVSQTTTITMTGIGPNVQIVDAGSTDVNLLLPPEADGAYRRIVNKSASAMVAVRDDGDAEIGEDMNFFQDCVDAGFPVWCDPTVRLGHEGGKVYCGALSDVLETSLKEAAE